VKEAASAGLVTVDERASRLSSLADTEVQNVSSFLNEPVSWEDATARAAG